MKGLWGAILGLLVGIAAYGQGDGQDSIEWLDTVREETFQEAAKRVTEANALLVEYGLDALTVSGSYFKVEMDVYIEDADGIHVRVRPRLQADLSCPKLSKQWRLFIESISPTELPGIDPADPEPELYSGLRRILRETDLSMIDVGVGVKWDWPPAPFVEVELERIFQFDPWRVHPNQTFFWLDGEGFGTVTSLRVDWWLSDRMIARSESSVRLSESSPGWEWEETLGLAYIFGGTRGVAQHAFGAHVSAFGNYEDGTGSVNLYRATLLYRRPVCGDWLYVRFAGGAEVRYENERETVPFVRIGVDALFSRKEERK